MPCAHTATKPKEACNDRPPQSKSTVNTLLLVHGTLDTCIMYLTPWDCSEAFPPGW